MTRNLSFLRYLKRKNIQDRLLFLKWYRFIEKSQWWTADELKSYQWKMIGELLREAYTFVPYYTELFGKLDARPEDIKTWEDFTKIPFLTKDIVRERINDLVSTRIKNKSTLRYYTTGGSTGEPLGFYRLRLDDAVSRAFMFQQWKRVGYKEDSIRVILRGEPLKDNQLFKRNRFTNDWVVSSYDLSADSIHKYIDFLNDLKPEFLHVYPSSLYIFTRLFIDSGLTLDFKPKAILCGSEPVRDFQRELFQETYKTRVYSWLGLSEGVVMAGECEHSTLYHAWPQFSYVEIVDKDDVLVREPGKSGEITGTSLNNTSFPFIRYKTGDIGELHSYSCEHCKRNFPVISKIDRWLQEIIVSKNGVYVSATGLNMHSDIFDNAVQFQFLQENPGELIVLVVTKDSFSSTDIDIIQKELSGKLGKEFEIIIKPVKNIPRTASGKHRYLVQKLSLDI